MLVPEPACARYNTLTYIAYRTLYRVAQNDTIGQWRRRLECVVQQQGGHIEDLMQKLQDVTVTLDNNWDNKHVVSCCNFFKCVVTEVVSFSIVAFKTPAFHKAVQRHTWGMVGSLVTVLLQIVSWFWQWNNLENRLIFGQVKAYNKWCRFWATR